VELLQEELQNLTGRRVNLKIEEIARPEIMAQLVAEEIAQQLAKRSSFRRTLKRAIETTMDAGAKESRFSWRVGSVDRKWRGARKQRRFPSAVDAASQDRLRFYRSRYSAGEHRRSSVGQSRYVRGRRFRWR